MHDVLPRAQTNRFTTKRVSWKFKTFFTSRRGGGAPESMATAFVRHMNRILSLMVEISRSVSLVPVTLQMLSTLGDRDGLLDKIEKKYD